MDLEAARQEVLDLHKFLTHWLTGSVAKTDDVFERFRDALADDFTVIHPGGGEEGKAGALRNFYQSHGNRGSEFALEITEVNARRITADTALVVYRERHRGEESRNRICSALLRDRGAGQLPLWLHLHETLSG